MILASIKRLEFLCKTVPPLLTASPELLSDERPAAGKWSRKEILGHLIDSATNNHQRFVRAQFENVPFIHYDQVNWNFCSRYNDMSREHLVEFWTLYNLHLLELIKRIPGDSLGRYCNSGDKQPVTLEWLIYDYIRHMEHHLKQLVALPE